MLMIYVLLVYHSLEYAAAIEHNYVSYCTMVQSHTPYSLKVNPLKSLSHHFFLIC